MADDSAGRDLLLNQLADEFAARYRRGERPALTEYAARYPELADDIRDLFPALVGMEQVKEDRRAIAPPARTLPPLEALERSPAPGLSSSIISIAGNSSRMSAASSG